MCARKIIHFDVLHVCHVFIIHFDVLHACHVCLVCSGTSICSAPFPNPVPPNIRILCGQNGRAQLKGG